MKVGIGTASCGAFPSHTSIYPCPQGKRVSRQYAMSPATTSQCPGYNPLPLVSDCWGKDCYYYSGLPDSDESVMSSASQEVTAASFPLQGIRPNPETVTDGTARVSKMGSWTPSEVNL
ncbi:hypothetical protein CGRA01v4_14347 [Colletotrichum graminicola]|nr:hypothetical protein CGRA01v4_14347 [Colletotrichum graminicola]